MVIENNQQEIQAEIEHENDVLDDLTDQTEHLEELAKIAEILKTPLPEEGAE